MTAIELKSILALHKLWLEGYSKGVRADLRSADLCSADLRGANLCSANLRSADLSSANLYRAVLYRADLRGADLSNADLCGANLCRADLRGADLSDANLSSADLSGADLRGADLYRADLYRADLRSANLSVAALSSANLTHIKDDFYEIISCVPGEIPALYKAVLDGKIDGSTYHGECACLVGTIANACGTKYDELKSIVPDSERPAERWFLSIRPGDNPDNNPVSAIVNDWITSYCQDKGIALPTRTLSGK